jgi:transposase-like protein
MPINPHNPFKGRHHPGEATVFVRWYLRNPRSYEHVTELLTGRGVEADASCIWRSVQAYARFQQGKRTACQERSSSKCCKKRQPWSSALVR